MRKCLIVFFTLMVLLPVSVAGQSRNERDDSREKEEVEITEMIEMLEVLDMLEELEMVQAMDFLAGEDEHEKNK